MASHVRVAIVGSGFAGLGTAIRLKQRGISDFVVLERAGEIGGVWRDNAYPGCACDVPSHLYSFSFAPNPGWTRAYSPQPEIWEYLRRCARQFGLEPHLRLGHELREARWDEAARRWQLDTSRGAFTAEVLVAAAGGLSEPSIPTIPGLERFEGKTMHSARWDAGYPLKGKRVALVGTGASAIQIVPKIAPEVAQLTLLQRTPPWVMPHSDRPLSDRKRAVYRSVPGAQRLVRAAIFTVREAMVLGFRHPALMRLGQRIAQRHMERAISDPALRAKLTPSFTLGCKRVLISNDYYPALARPNVEVVTEAIREITPRAVRLADGTEREVDALIFGTGFQVTHPKIGDHVRGRGGRTLTEVWAGSPKAHLGTTVTGFPNLFLLQGPNTGLGHTSVLVMIEAQIEHALRAIDHLGKTGAVALEPRPEAQDAFVAEVDRKMEGTVWTAGGCASWYLDDTGRNSTLWPGFSFTFARRVSRFDPADYLLERA